MTASTSKNTARKTAQQRAQDQALNGHDKSVKDVEPKAAHAGTSDAASAKPAKEHPTEAQYAYAAYCSSLGIHQTEEVTITFKNMIAGFVASLCAMVVGYATGLWLVDMLAYGLFLLTGWAYLSLAVLVIGWIITLIASLYAGGKVAHYVGTGQYTKDLDRLGGWFKSKFSSASEAVKTSMFNDNKAAA